MSLVDKVTGRIKQALGDVSKDPQMRREGIEEERKGEKKEELYQSQTEAERKEQEVSDAERRTE